jgi:hypothetical protein
MCEPGDGEGGYSERIAAGNIQKRVLPGVLDGILRPAAQRFSARCFMLWRKYFGPQNRTF